MKQFLCLISFIVLFSSSLIAQTRTTIAVMDLGAAGVAESDAQVITSRLRTDLFNTKKYIVLERDKVNEVLNEQGFQQSMCTTNECVVEVGKLIGVQQMVAGEIGKVGNLFTITIRLIDVETGKVIKTATEDCECKIEQVVTQSVRNVAEILAGNKIQTETYTTSLKQNNNFNDAGITEREMMGISRDEYIDYKKSGLTEEEWEKNNIQFNLAQKSALSESMKSLLFSGWGQLSMDRNRGSIYLITEVICIGGFVLTNTRNDDLPLIFFGVGILNKLTSIIDAGFTTPHYNEELKKKYKLSFSPKQNRYSKQPMIGLNISF